MRTGIALKPWLVVSLLMTLSSAAGAEPTAVVRLWTGDPPGPKHVVQGPEQDMTKPTDKLIAGRPIIKLGNVATPEMHVFLPQPLPGGGDVRGGNIPAVVICPGGGFSILAWDLEGTEVAQWLNSIGVAGIVLKYRVPTRDIEPRWLLPVQDTQRALSLVRSRATQWGLDPQRLGVLGFSAGGNTAGMAAVKDGERQYPAADDADKLSCRADFAVLIYPGGFLDEQQQLRPEVQITKQMPPVFMAQAFDDQGPAQNCLTLAGALRKVGVPCELHLYDRGGHGFGLRSQPDFPVTTWPSRCAEWLRVQGLLTEGSNPGHPDR